MNASGPTSDGSSAPVVSRGGCGGFAFAGVLALFLVLGTGRWAGFVVPKTLRFFGRISYGLYLIHFMMFDKYDAIATRYFSRLMPSQGQLSLFSIRFLIASAAAIMVAWISRETFEELFLALGKPRARETSSVGAAHAAC